MFFDVCSTKGGSIPMWVVMAVHASSPSVEETTMYDEANNPIGTYDAYLKDVHVGNSAQLTSALSASFTRF